MLYLFWLTLVVEQHVQPFIDPSFLSVPNLSTHFQSDLVSIFGVGEWLYLFRANIYLLSLISLVAIKLLLSGALRLLIPGNYTFQPLNVQSSHTNASQLSAYILHFISFSFLIFFFNLPIQLPPFCLKHFFLRPYF